MLINLKKILHFGVQNFARNFWLAILTISILILLLLSINALVVINFLTDEASRQMKSKVDISIYLKPDVSNEEAQSLRNYLADLPTVASVTYTEPDQVLKSFKENHAADDNILSSLKYLEDNPFGGLLVVQTVKVDDYKTVLSQINTPVYKKIIENKDFNDHEKLVNAVNRVTGFVKQFIIIVSIFFAFIALVIIFNTIKIAIYTHREEIGIMRLVGASGWFIRAPFIVEAVFYSLLAVAISFILVFPMVGLIQPKVFDFFNSQGGDIIKYYRMNFFGLFGIQLAIVASLSAASAALAIGRYLKK
ncbi:MAG: permease-like cell division protein FtsX [Patescibacteria group bacterium]